MTNEQARTESDSGGDASGSSGDLVFDTLWKRALEAWDQDPPHHAVLDYAVRKQKLPELAARYRALVENLEKRDRAQKKLDGVVTAATQLLLSTKTSAPQPSPRNALYGVVLVCAAILLYLAYTFARAR